MLRLTWLYLRACFPCKRRINLSPFTKDFRAWEAHNARWKFLSCSSLGAVITKLLSFHNPSKLARIDMILWLRSTKSWKQEPYSFNRERRSEVYNYLRAKVSQLTYMSKGCGSIWPGCLNDQAYIAWFTSTRGVCQIWMHDIQALSEGATTLHLSP